MANNFPISVSIGNTVGDSRFRRALADASKGGMAPIIDAFDEFCEDLDLQVMPDVLAEALQPTLELSQRYVPYKTGTLHDSAFIAIAKVGRGNQEAQIGYAKNDEAPYALIVHEDLTARHDPPTRAKYLQTAIDEDFYDILQRIGNSIRKRQRGL